MATDFFNPQIHQALLARLEQLSSSAKPKWGVMNPAQMLRHLQLESDLALGRYRGTNYTNRIKEWMFKKVITGRMPLPAIFSKMRLVAAIPELDVVKSKIEVEDFTTEKERALNGLRELLQSSLPGKIHPAIGRMSSDDWGAFYAWHTDYHLRQFGL